MTDHLDATGLGLLRSSLVDHKSRFRAVANRGEPCKAWLMRVTSLPDISPEANFARMGGFDARRSGVFALGGERWASLPEPLQSVADDAARSVKQLPVDIAKLLPPECWCSTADDWRSWVAVVFGLAWSPVRCSPIHAERVVPLNDRESILLESVPGMKDWPLHLTDEQIAAVREKGWYSTLDDFAAASVQAIDVLMSWLDDVPKRETEVNSKPPKSVETLAGGDDVGGRQQSSLPPRDVQHNVPISGNSPTNMATIVLMTVNEHETKALHHEFTPPTLVTKGEVTYGTLGTHGGCLIVHTQCDMGSGGTGGSQERTREAIEHWKPHAIIAVGIAFGLDESTQSIGDVLVSSQIQNCDLSRLNEDDTHTLRGDKPPSSPALLSRFKMINAQKQQEHDWPKVRFGLVLCRQLLVDNLPHVERLKQAFPEAIGGEMEGYGVYTSAQKAKVDWIVVKAICDWGHNKNDAEKDKWQRLAAKNAARVLKAALDAGGLYET